MKKTQTIPKNGERTKEATPDDSKLWTHTPLLCHIALNINKLKKKKNQMCETFFYIIISNEVIWQLFMSFVSW